MKTSVTNYKGFRINQAIILAFILVFIIIVVSLIQPRFISIDNLINILLQIVVLGILSFGMNLLMISGGLDLSIGMNISLSACIITTLVSANYNLALSITAGFLTSVLCGFINGLIISKSGGMPFVITLGTMTVFNGIALVITKGESHSLKSKFQYLGQAKLGFLPVSVIILIVIGLVTFFILKYSKLGRALFAIGGNEKAAVFSGIKPDRVKILIYTLNGVIVGIASLVLVSRLGSAVPTTGSGYELRTIAAVVVGGTSLFGGRGNVFGCLMGVTLLGVVSNVLNVLNVSYFFQGTILGTIIIGAAIISTFGIARK